MFNTSFEELFASSPVKTMTVQQVVNEIVATKAGYDALNQLTDSGEEKLDFKVAAVGQFARLDEQDRLDKFKMQAVWDAIMRAHNKIAKTDAALQGHNNFKRLDGRGVFKDQLVLENNVQPFESGPAIAL